MLYPTPFFDSGTSWLGQVTSWPKVRYELTKNGYELTKVRVDLGTSWIETLWPTRQDQIKDTVVCWWQGHLLGSFQHARCPNITTGSWPSPWVGTSMRHGIRPQCVVIHVTRARATVPSEYLLHGHILESVGGSKYLGVEISDNLSFNNHIQKICTSASRSLGLIKRNFRTKSPAICEMAYKTLVRRLVEYSSSVWSPYTHLHLLLHLLKKVLGPILSIVALC